MERYDYDSIKKRIQSIDIQGATNIAAAVLEALELFSREYTSADVHDYVDQVKKEGVKLATIRPTEPLALNGVKYVLSFLNTLRGVSENKTVFKQATQDFLEVVLNSTKIMSSGGSKFLHENNVANILTHCHSSSVVSLLAELNKLGEIKVIATETRPKYQGHITVRDLIDKGVNVSMCVDLESGYFLYNKKVDAVLIGNDELLENGDILNKVGSLAIAFMAKKRNIPVYTVGSLLKFSRLEGRDVDVEYRNIHELLEEDIEGLKIINPAFDLVPNDLISRYITEVGVLSKDEINKKVLLSYPFI